MKKNSRIVSFEEARDIRENARKEGKTVVFTNGCFDILHAGHVEYLERARSMGDLLIVGLNSDESVRKIKGPSRPINTENDRAHVLAGLRSVDYLVIFHEDTPNALIEVIQPDIHVKGGDYKDKKIWEREIVEKHGGRVVLVDLVPGRSTTNLIQKIEGRKE